MSVKNIINIFFIIFFLISTIISILFFYNLINVYKITQFFGISYTFINEILYFVTIKQVIYYLWLTNLLLITLFMYINFKGNKNDKSLYEYLLAQEKKNKLISYMVSNSWGDIEWIAPIFAQIFVINANEINNNVNYLNKLENSKDIYFTSADKERISQNFKLKRSSYVDIPTKLGSLESAFRVTYTLIGEKYIWQVMLIKQDLFTENNYFMNDVLLNLPLPFSIKDINSQIIYANKKFNKTFLNSINSNWDDIIVKTQEHFFQEETSTFVQKSLVRNLYNEEYWAYIVENVIYDDNNNVKYVRSVIIPLDANNYLLQDILLEQNYKDVIINLCDNSPFMTFMLDEDHNVIKINAKAATLLNNEYNQEVLTPFSRLLSQGVAHLYDTLELWLKNTKENLEIELPYVSSYSTPHYYKVIAIPLYKSTLIYLLDINHEKELSAQVRLSQGLQTVGQIASTVAHDFNNFLTAMMSFNYFAQETQEEDSPARAELEQMKQISQKSKIMIKRLLTYSRKQDLTPVAFDVNSEISDLMSTIFRLMGEKVTAKFIRGKNVGKILLDKVQFQQVITNLVVNAKDAMRIGGKLEIITQAQLVKNSFTTALGTIIPEGKYVVIKIVDQGSGIPKENIPLIFQSHFSTKGEKGNGLGLYNVNSIVTENAGFIDITSTIGEGSTFYLYFPSHNDADLHTISSQIELNEIPQEETNTNILHTTTQELIEEVNKEISAPNTNESLNINKLTKDTRVKNPKKSAPKLSVKSKKKMEKEDISSKEELENLKLFDLTGHETILLVEDELPVRMVCSRLLKSKGYNVIEAEDGETALEKLKVKDIKHIDLVISDVMMPGINGPELISRLKDIYPTMKAILISGYTEDVLEDINVDIAMKGISFLEKPFTPDIFAKKVKNIINNQE